MTLEYEKKLYEKWLKRLKVGDEVEVTRSGFVKDTYSNHIIVEKTLFGVITVSEIDRSFRKGISKIDDIRYYQLGPIDGKRLSDYT